MQTLWQNPEMAADMGRKAEKRYWKLFTADKMVDSYVDLYKELMDFPLNGKPNLNLRLVQTPRDSL